MIKNEHYDIKKLYHGKVLPKLTIEMSCILLVMWAFFNSKTFLSIQKLLLKLIITEKTKCFGRTSWSITGWQSYERQGYIFLTYAEG